MILVAGETLVDLVLADDGGLEAALGGAPSNTAVAVARLGVPVGFIGAVSTDRFGDRLLRRLEADGVGTRGVVRVEEPTSLAMAELDASGAATYRFYFAGTSVPRLDTVDLAGATAVFTGGLGLVLEPMASTIEAAVVAATVPVIVDVNARPAVVDDLEAFRERVVRIAGHTRLLKVSDEDLEVLAPGVDAVDAAGGLVDAGAGSVVVTRGSASTTVITADGSLEVAVPPLPANRTVVDTIGAGDTFAAGVLASLYDQGALHRWGGGTTDAIPALDELAEAVELGHAAAAVTVTRRGADPPRRADLGR